MRFKTELRNIQTFSRFIASLSFIGKVAWIRLDDDQVRFTIIPENGSQVWAVLRIDAVFEDYSIKSAAERNTINLELPLPPLQRALKSAINATSASLRLTKKDGIPVLSLTIVSNSATTSVSLNNNFSHARSQDPFAEEEDFYEENVDLRRREIETTITQDIPVRVVMADSVEHLHEPQMREPECHVVLPSLTQLKAISDRFTRLASATGGSIGSGNSNVPILELSANMFGGLKLGVRTDSLNVESVWTGLTNPALDPLIIEEGVEGVRNHPSTRLKAKGPNAWVRVRIDGRDWGKVLSVGRMGGRVIACFVDEHAIVLYVYITHPGETEESVLTYYISSYAV